MNISNLNFLPQKIDTNNINQTNQQKYFVTSKIEADSFEKTGNKQVSFKGAPQNIYKKILENPDLSQKFMKLIAMGAAALLALASGNDSNKETEEIINPNATDENLSNLIKEVLNQESEAVESNETPAQEDIEDSEANNDLVNVEFPKRRGKLSFAQQALKETVNELKVSQSTSEKLTAICQSLLDKNKTDYGIDAKTLAEDLASKNGNIEELEAYINECFEKYENKATTQELNPPVEETPSEDNSTDSQEAEEVSTSGETTDIKAKTTGGRVVGHVDLEKLEALKKKVQSTEKPSSQKSAEKPARERFRIWDAYSEYKKATTSIIDREKGVFSFRIDKVMDRNVKTNLTILLLNFEELSSKVLKRSKWIHHTGLQDRVLKEDIIQELKSYDKSPYKQVMNYDPEEVAELINEVDEFKKLFRLHSALRFIDRFFDLDNGLPTPEECKEKIHILYKAINTAIKNGLEIQSYKNFNKISQEDEYAARLVIEPDEVKNPYAYMLSPDTPILLTVCEKQSRYNYYKDNKTPIINTLYAMDI